MFFQPLQQIIKKVILILLLSCTGFACTCIPVTLDAELQEADMVFAGKVITNKEAMFREIILRKHFPFLGLSLWREHEAIIQVSQIWKGSFSEKIQINYYPDICGPSVLKVGEDYIVFAFKRGEDLRIVGCSRTMPIKYAEKDLPLLGKSVMVSSKPSDAKLPNQFTTGVKIGIAGLICTVWLLRKKLLKIKTSNDSNYR